MIFLSYRQLVLHPHASIGKIMKQAKLLGVWKDFKTNVHTDSLDLLVTLPITYETLINCEQLYQQLDML